MSPSNAGVAQSATTVESTKGDNFAAVEEEYKRKLVAELAAAEEEYKRKLVAELAAVEEEDERKLVAVHEAHAKDEEEYKRKLVEELAAAEEAHAKDKEAFVAVKAELVDKEKELSRVREIYIDQLKICKQETEVEMSQLKQVLEATERSLQTKLEDERALREEAERGDACATFLYSLANDDCKVYKNKMETLCKENVELKMRLCP